MQMWNPFVKFKNLIVKKYVLPKKKERDIKDFDMNNTNLSIANRVNARYTLVNDYLVKYISD